MMMIDVPFFDWLFPRDPPLSEEEHLVRQQQRSKSRAPSSNASSSDLLSDGDSSTDGRDSSAGGDSTTGGGSEESGRTKTGSWIVHHDNHGVPYWINDVTGEATYALFIHHMGRGTPITYVENRHPYQLRSPATPPPSTTATIGYPSTTNETSSSSNGSKVGNIGGTSDVGDNSNKSDETSIRKAEKSCGGRGRPGGVWEELYHKVTGAKIWYHTGTKKTTTKDPFF